jgi:heptosyltransferase-2/heptosyltransferase-3
MRCGALGDMVLLTPLIRQISERFATPVDLVSSGPWTRPLLEGQPGVGRIFLLESRRRPYLFGPDQWRLVRALRERGPGPTWFMDPDAIGRHLLGRAGIEDRWIVDADAFARQPDEHYLQRFARVGARSPAALGGGDAPGPLRGSSLERSPDGDRDLDHWLGARGLAGKPLLLVQAGNKRTMRRGDRRRASNTKYWPEPRWARVIDAMAARCPDHAILLLGVPSERALNDDILRHVTTPLARNAADDLPIPRLVALMARAQAMVTVDTGPAHVAAAVGLPLVVLFGAAEPALYRPWGATESPVAIVTATPRGPLEGLAEAPVMEAFRALPLRSERAGPIAARAADR